MSSCLYLIATPIGNLGDITLRSLETLKQVDVIYCEDTRKTRILCHHYEIHTPLKTYHEHNAQQVRAEILSRLESGENLALVSDAGTPLISDPGFKLVQACLQQGHNVQSLPGPSAVITALTLSGLPTNEFHFFGFMPPKKTERQKLLQDRQYISGTQIYFETANRLLETLSDIQTILNDREICVARELTKAFETLQYGSAQDIMHYYETEGTLKGEIVLLIKGSKQEPVVSPMVEQVLGTLLATVPVKQASQWLAALTGLPKGVLYQRALDLKDKADES